jgi:cytidylate kinase
VAPDAVVVDTTGLSIDEVVDRVMALVAQRHCEKGNPGGSNRRER